MKTLHISSENKSYFVRRYTDYVVSHMDNLEILDGFKNYFYNEKIDYPVSTLEQEIGKYCPEILEDHIQEKVVGKGKEYAKNF